MSSAVRETWLLGEGVQQNKGRVEGEGLAWRRVGRRARGLLSQSVGGPHIVYFEVLQYPSSYTKQPICFCTEFRTKDDIQRSESRAKLKSALDPIRAHMFFDDFSAQSGNPLPHHFPLVLSRTIS